MKSLREKEVPWTVNHKGRRYLFNRLHGWSSAVYRWKGFEILVEFKRRKKQKRLLRAVICDTEEDTQFLRKEDG